MSKEDDIRLLFETERIWPPIATRDWPNRRRFVQALKEVLKRLPDEGVAHVSNEIGFIVDDGFALAFNVPGTGRDCDQIVIFREAFQLSDEKLMGLIVHELAHSFVATRDHDDNEQAANELVKRWGFGDYL